MKVVLSRRATRRLHAIADYIFEHNPTAASKVEKSIRDAFALLARYPEAGQAVEHGVRRFTLPRFPYLIYYTVDVSRNAVVIITVRHAAQNRPR